MKWLVLFVTTVAAILIAAADYLQSLLPTPEQICGCMTTSMYKVYLCPESKDYVPLKSISSYLQKTITLTEDSDFWNHHGFDWTAIEKNFREGWEKGEYKRGGSTITQQLAKNMFLNKERTFLRKAFEALITDRIERSLSKKEILERYLNVVEFGKNIYGVKQASTYYFKKEAADLDVVESAFLAMVLPNPEKYSRSYFKKELTPFARSRLNRIVEDLFRYKRINETEYQAALAKIQNFLSPEPPPDETGTPEDSMTLQDLEKAEKEDPENNE